MKSRFSMRVRLLTAVIFFAGAAMAQSSGTLTVVAQVRPSILLSGTAPDGTTFSQGGDDAAGVNISLLTAPTQKFTARALAANNPQSSGYQVRARLASPVNATVLLDGITLATTDAVISHQNPYHAMQHHSVDLVGAATAPITIVFTCAPE